MSRFFIEISYKGTNFCGWQKQDNAISIQEKIESTLSQLYNDKISVVGCGRTDAGVHAKQFYLHVDLDEHRFTRNDLSYKLNMMLGQDIVVRRVIPVSTDAHARFDALSRSYEYVISFKKDPFRTGLYYEYDQAVKPDLGLLRKAAKLITDFSSFYPFCKSNSDVENYECRIIQSEWIQISDDSIVYHISANRFLRGMVRLLVGMCINVACDKLTMEEVHSSLKSQQRLSRPWSVPSEGLFLTKITYPYINHIE